MEQAIYLTIIGTRQYAKRQRTVVPPHGAIRWFKAFGEDPLAGDFAIC